MTSRSRSRPQFVVPPIIFCALGICCSLCICIGALINLIFKGANAAINYELPRTAKRREEREREEKRARTARVNAPRILGPRLHGALTIGRDISEGNGHISSRVIPIISKNTNAQLQSRLFRLPVEVRRQVLEDTIGGYLIHIYCFEAYKKMGHVRCKTPPGGICSCRHFYKLKGMPDGFGNIDLLAPLTSCRKLYSEAIEILYRSNTFDFDYLGHVLKLSLMIIPERMRLIENVQWDYHHEYDLLSSIALASNATRVPWSVWSTSRPWYNCRSPAKCPCLDCWSKFYPGDLASHKFIIYDWIMPQGHLSSTSDPAD